MRKLDTTRHSQRELAAEVGRRIQGYRKEKRWTRPVLANFLEIKAQWLEDYENGVRLPPTYTLYQLACIFGISVGCLLDDLPAERPLQGEELLRMLRHAETLAKRDRREIGEFFSLVVSSFRKLLYD